MAIAEVRSESPQDIQEGVETRLETAHSLLMTSASLLGELQSLEQRDQSREERIAIATNDLIGSFSTECYKVGVKSAEGSGILTTQWAPKGWMKNRTRKERKEYKKTYDFTIQQFPGEQVDGYFLFHGIQRGDKLGYGSELGNNWYLMFGWKEKYYIPVSTLRNVNLMVVDDGF